MERLAVQIVWFAWRFRLLLGMELQEAFGPGKAISPRFDGALVRPLLNRCLEETTQLGTTGENGWRKKGHALQELRRRGVL